MCGRFTLTRQDYDQLGRLFGVDAVEPGVKELARPRFNVAPSDRHPLVLSAGLRVFGTGTWGLVPEWCRDGKGFINARIESADNLPAFREAVRRRRCGIPADGFFEWTGEGASRRPIWFSFSDRRAFLFAGLFHERESATSGAPERTFAILTTDAGGLLKSVHPRMPVILPTEDTKAWLTDERWEELRRRILASRLVPDEARPVSRYVNSPRNDDARCIEPASQ